MMTDDYTDSLFASEVDAGDFGTEWQDVRLIHESARGWCVLYSCLYRGHRVVVKTLKDEYRDSEIHRRLLEKEYAIGHSMNHVNVVEMMWMQDVPGFGPSILMEHLDGVTLGGYLASRSELDSEEVIQIVDQICSAVDYLHSRQVIHCDLKPSNLMMVHQGRYVKLIDFGSSRGFGYEKLDFAGGTQGFTAPENLKGDGGEVSPRTDVYSIGRLIELMDTKGVFCNIVGQCTSADPSLRPAHVSDIPRLMRRCLQHNRRRRVAAATMAATTAAVVLVGVLIMWWRAERVSVGEETKQTSAVDSVTIVQPGEPIVLDSPNIDSAMSDKLPVAVSEIADVVEAYKPADVDPEVKPEVTKPTDPLPAETDETLPLDAQLYQHALQVASRRFRDHINMIDTMTTMRTRQLVGVNHWRWLAKQDVRRWLESKLLPGNPRVETLLADAEKAIKDYGNDENRKGLEYQHYQRAIKRKPSLAGVVLVNRRVDYEKDRYYVDSLLEDGTWYKAAGSLTPLPKPKDFGWF